MSEKKMSQAEIDKAWQEMMEDEEPIMQTYEVIDEENHERLKKIVEGWKQRGEI